MKVIDLILSEHWYAATCGKQNIAYYEAKSHDWIRQLNCKPEVILPFLCYSRITYKIFNQNKEHYHHCYIYTHKKWDNAYIFTAHTILLSLKKNGSLDLSSFVKWWATTCFMSWKIELNWDRLVNSKSLRIIYMFLSRTLSPNLKKTLTNFFKIFNAAISFMTA